LGDGSLGEHLDQWCTHAEIGKGLFCTNFWSLSASGVPTRGEGTRDQHKVARLPVGNIDRRDTNCAGFCASATKSGLGAGRMKKRFTTYWPLIGAAKLPPA
jgi:hypothetical protein